MNTKGRLLIGVLLVLSTVMFSRSEGIATPPALATYEISFPNGNEKPTGENITIRGEVRVEGDLVHGGTTVFQRCEDPVSRTGTASSLCESHNARWDEHLRFELVDGYFEFLARSDATTPQTIGWRFIYRGMGNGVKNGISEPADAVWIQP